MPTLKIRESDDGQFQWQVFGGNGEHQATGETQPRKFDAKRGFDDLLDSCLVISWQRGDLEDRLSRLGIEVNTTQPQDKPGSVQDFIGTRPPERPPRKPSPLDNLNP